MTILVCGSRTASMKSVRPLAEAILSKHDPNTTTVIHGDCRGADTWAALAALTLGMKVVPYPADWGTYGKAAGPIRNQRMLDEGKPDLVLAFTPSLKGGTWDMITRARKANIETRIVWTKRP